jgi:hypothetical protein
VKLVQSVGKFLLTVANHLRETVASAVAQFLQLLTPYLLENLPAEEVRLNWEDASFEDTQIDAILFNRFFHSHTHSQALHHLSRHLAKPPAFLLQITVMLSEWLLRLGHSNAALKIKTPPTLTDR